MADLRRVGGSTWGASLATMMSLYTRKVRPAITYACGAWYQDSPGHGCLSNAAIDGLRGIQTMCLVRMSGAMPGCPTPLLRKELGIPDIILFLRRLALTSRARALPDQSLETLNKSYLEWSDDLTQWQGGHNQVSHGYVDAATRANGEAAQLIVESFQTWRREHPSFPSAAMAWEEGTTASDQVKKYARSVTDGLTADSWDHWRKNRLEQIAAGTVEAHKKSIALDSSWEHNSISDHDGLCRAESTALLQMRTEAIELHNHLHMLNFSDTTKCTCGAEQQTAMHMLMECPELEQQRVALLRPHPHLCEQLAEARLNTTTTTATTGGVWSFSFKDLDPGLQREVRTCLFIDDAKHTARWALLHFPIDNWAGGRSRIKRELANSQASWFERPPSLGEPLERGRKRGGDWKHRDGAAKRSRRV